jgi:predicted branched-subunit amino acid permease
VFNYLFIMLVNLFDRSSVFRIIIAIAASVIVYAGMTQYSAAQYLVNISSIAVLAGLLKFLR